MDCKTNPKYVDNVTCYVKDLGGDKSHVQMDCTLLEPLRNATTRIKLHKKDYTDQYKPFLVNVAFKVCDLIARKTSLPYGLGHLFARDMVFGANNLPSSIPLGVYWVTITFLENYAGGSKANYGTVNWYWEIMRPKRKPKKNKV
ncbi:uncharacterized protein LOC117592251 [Drosophila guanche]|uniref:uncharacterized protein LOC117592251 n=1 Tax=Drosophila guanche TaxID=7266 RepID=UPI0014719463|nr:uncharacterized protein LOC117592251 [Drosophila guanche]